MNTITSLDAKIDHLKKQMAFLENDTKYSTNDKADLLSYYKNKLNLYVARKQTLIKNIEVKAEIIQAKTI